MRVLGMTAETDRDDEASFWAKQRAEASRSKRNEAERDKLRLEAATVQCPHCHAPRDYDCRNKRTGKPLNNIPCHPIRLTHARRYAKLAARKDQTE